MKATLLYIVSYIVIGTCISLVCAGYDYDQTCRCENRTSSGFCDEWRCEGDAKSNAGCFSLDTPILTVDGSKEIGQLQVGDKVLSLFDGDTIVDYVYDFLHYSPNEERELFRIEFDSGSTIWVSDKHLVFLDEQTAVFAYDLEVGMVLEGWNNLVTITAITKEMKNGIIAPLTYSGTYIVGDISVSNYAEVEYHQLSHWAFVPLRTYRMVFGTPTEKLPVEGIHPYAQSLAKLFHPSIVERSAANTAASNNNNRKKRQPMYDVYPFLLEE